MLKHAFNIVWGSVCWVLLMLMALISWLVVNLVAVPLITLGFFVQRLIKGYRP